MLKKKAIKRIVVTTIALLVVLVVYSINKTDTVIYDDTYYIKENDMQEIYTITKDNLVAKTSIYVNYNLDIEEQVSNVLCSMIEENNNNSLLPGYFKPILPNNTIILSVKLNDDILTIDFSKELLNITEEQSEKMIESIVYTTTNFDEVLGVSILVEGKSLKYVPNTSKELNTILDNNYGINKVYNITNNNNVEKVVLYYLSGIDDLYITPVTEYINTNKQKLEVIIDKLSNSYSYNNLISYLNSNTKLLDYEINENVINLNFNENIYDSKEKKTIDTNSLNSIIYSIFDNYKVDKINILVNNNKILEKYRKDIEN